MVLFAVLDQLLLVPGVGLPERRLLQQVRDVQVSPEGKWIVIRYAFPTRLKEARFPTKAELDSVAPKHPVLYHAGPAGLATAALLGREFAADVLLSVHGDQDAVVCKAGADLLK